MPAFSSVNLKYTSQQYHDVQPQWLHQYCKTRSIYRTCWAERKHKQLYIYSMKLAQCKWYLSKMNYSKEQDEGIPSSCHGCWLFGIQNSIRVAIAWEEKHYEPFMLLWLMLWTSSPSRCGSTHCRQSCFRTSSGTSALLCIEAIERQWICLAPWKAFSKDLIKLLGKSGQHLEGSQTPSSLVLSSKKQEYSPLHNTQRSMLSLSFTLESSPYAKVLHEVLQK